MAWYWLVTQNEGGWAALEMVLAIREFERRQILSPQLYSVAQGGSWQRMAKAVKQGFLGSPTKQFQEGKIL